MKEVGKENSLDGRMSKGSGESLELL